MALEIYSLSGKLDKSERHALCTRFRHDTKAILFGFFAGKDIDKRRDKHLGDSYHTALTRHEAQARAVRAAAQQDIQEMPLTLNPL